MSKIVALFLQTGVHKIVNNIYIPFFFLNTTKVYIILHFFTVTIYTAKHKKREEKNNFSSTKPQSEQTRGFLHN